MFTKNILLYVINLISTYQRFRKGVGQEHDHLWKTYICISILANSLHYAKSPGAAKILQVLQ